jgi:hypothetical protein
MAQDYGRTQTTRCVTRRATGTGNGEWLMSNRYRVGNRTG